jgi:hypothetical protein
VIVVPDRLEVVAEELGHPEGVACRPDGIVFAEVRSAR